MWQLGNPVYGWALAALMVPVLIHLYNRRQTKVKILGSLRWLKEVQPAQANFRRIYQWPLLLIRLALLTAVVFLLMDLYKHETTRPPAKLQTLILIHPEAGDTVQLRQLAAAWQNDSVKAVWLASNFPAVKEPLPPLTETSVWLSVAEAEQRFPADSIQVIAPNRADYFAGKPPQTATTLSWELTDWKKDTTRLLQAILTGKEPELLWFRSDANLTETDWQLKKTGANQPRVEWAKGKQLVKVTNGKTAYEIPVHLPDTLVVAGMISPDRREEWQMLRNAIQAVGIFHRVPVRFTENPAKAAWIVSMGRNDSVKKSKATQLWLSYHPGQSAGWLEPIRTDSLVVHKELTTKAILEGGLLQALRPYVLAFKSQRVIMPAVDFRKTSLIAHVSRHKENSKIAAAGQKSTLPVHFWLGIMTLVLLAIERAWPK